MELQSKEEGTGARTKLTEAFKHAKKRGKLEGEYDHKICCRKPVSAVLQVGFQY